MNNRQLNLYVVADQTVQCWRTDEQRGTLMKWNVAGVSNEVEHSNQGHERLVSLHF